MTTATSRCCSAGSSRRSRATPWTSTRPLPSRFSGMHPIRRSADGCATAGTRPWSSCCATSRDTASRASSPRAAAATSCGRSPTRSTQSHPSASSAARTGCSTWMTSMAARSGTSPSPTSSTTGRRSRCASGAGSDAVRSWPAGTRTATSRCSASPAAREGPRCGSSFCTTTPSASSTTRRARSRRSSERIPRTGPWSDQERLGDRLRRLTSSDRGVIVTLPCRTTDP